MGGRRRRKESELIKRIKRIQKATQEAVRFLIDAGIYPADELIETVNKTLIGISDYTEAEQVGTERIWVDDLTWPRGGDGPMILLMAHVAYYDDHLLTALMVHCLSHAMGEEEAAACYQANQYLLTKGMSIEDYEEQTRMIMRQVWDKIPKVNLIAHNDVKCHAIWFRWDWTW